MAKLKQTLYTDFYLHIFNLGPAESRFTLPYQTVLKKPTDLGLVCYLIFEFISTT